MFTCQNSSKNDDFSNFDHNWSLFKVQRKNASIKMEKKLGYNIYQCQMVSSGVVSNGVEWCGVKWCRVSVMTLESLVLAATGILYFPKPKWLLGQEHRSRQISLAGCVIGILSFFAPEPPCLTLVKENCKSL